MMRFAVVLAVIAAVAATGWWATRPVRLAAVDLPDYMPDPVAGERVFWAGGCASCHATPVDGKRARGDDKLKLGGGLELDTAFGVFRAPNISPHPRDGIGGWSMLDFVNAMQQGVSPDGRHYYPSFPYTSYARMRIEDVMDLRAWLDTLPAVEGRAAPHSIGFPWSVRRGIGLWKRRYLDTAPIARIETPSDAAERGRVLVEGVGHCGECHTPRDRFGGLLTAQWLGGGADPAGDGSVPNITPAGEDVSSWSESDIAYYFESGFTPEFDTVGGPMVAVQEGLARLTAGDRADIAAYLKAVPAVGLEEDKN